MHNCKVRSFLCLHHLPSHSSSTKVDSAETKGGDTGARIRDDHTTDHIISLVHNPTIHLDISPFALIWKLALRVGSVVHAHMPTSCARRGSCALKENPVPALASSVRSLESLNWGMRAACCTRALDRQCVDKDDESKAANILFPRGARYLWVPCPPSRAWLDCPLYFYKVFVPGEASA